MGASGSKRRNSFTKSLVESTLARKNQVSTEPKHGAVYVGPVSEVADWTLAKREKITDDTAVTFTSVEPFSPGSSLYSCELSLNSPAFDPLEDGSHPSTSRPATENRPAASYVGFVHPHTASPASHSASNTHSAPKPSSSPSQQPPWHDVVVVHESALTSPADCKTTGNPATTNCNTTTAPGFPGNTAAKDCKPTEERIEQRGKLSIDPATSTLPPAQVRAMRRGGNLAPLETENPLWFCAGEELQPELINDEAKEVTHEHMAADAKHAENRTMDLANELNPRLPKQVQRTKALDKHLQNLRFQTETRPTLENESKTIIRSEDRRDKAMNTERLINCYLTEQELLDCERESVLWTPEAAAVASIQEKDLKGSASNLRESGSITYDETELTLLQEIERDFDANI